MRGFTVIKERPRQKSSDPNIGCASKIPTSLILRCIQPCLVFTIEAWLSNFLRPTLKVLYDNVTYSDSPIGLQVLLPNVALAVPDDLAVCRNANNLLIAPHPREYFFDPAGLGCSWSRLSQTQSDQTKTTILTGGSMTPSTTTAQWQIINGFSPKLTSHLLNNTTKRVSEVKNDTEYSDWGRH